MAFTWTYPSPLDPNQPSVIGNHLRNVIPSLAVYIQELCDAIDTLRENIGQAPYIWTIYRPEVGDTLLYEHYRQIQLRLDSLIIDYEYNSVIDILGRNWSDYQTLYLGKSYAKWQIIQDFRDVCDFLSKNKLEQWTTFTNIPPTKSYAFTLPNGIIYWITNANGDIGMWADSEYMSGMTIYKKEEPLIDRGTVHAIVYGDYDYYIDEISTENELRYIGTGGAYTWQQGGVGWRAHSQVNYPYINLYDASDKNILLENNNYFRFKGVLDGNPAHIYSSSHFSWEDGYFYAYPGVTIVLRFNSSDTKFISFIFYFSSSPDFVEGTTVSGKNTNNVIITKTMSYPYGNIDFEYDIYNKLYYISGWNPIQEYKITELSFQGHSMRIFGSGNLLVGQSVSLDAVEGNYDIRINKIGLASSGS